MTRPAALHWSFWRRFVRCSVGYFAFGAGLGVLVLLAEHAGVIRSAPRDVGSAAPMLGWVPARAASALPAPTWRPPWVADDLAYEVRAVETVRSVAERDGFSLRSVQCWVEADYALCGICFSHPKRYLGTALVKCDAKRCYWPLDASEHARVGWFGEPECLVKDDK